jgi:hypothetical protein
VIDTSALVPSNPRRSLQQAARGRSFIAIWSPWIIGELYRVLTWQWLKRNPDFSTANETACSRSAKAMMALLIATFEIVAPVPPYPPAWDTLADIDGLPIYAAARLSGAQYVVSENTRDYPPPDAGGRHSYDGVEYLPAQRFLALLAAGSA